MVLTRFRFIPREERFFDLFTASAENVLAGAEALHDLLEHYVDVDRKARRLKDIEHQGDEITHEIFRALNRTFVTPLDREDISHLATALDDVLDWTEEVSRRLAIYRISEPTDLARKFAQVILEQARCLHQAVPLLANLRDTDKIHRAMVEIHRLENEGDDLFIQSLSTLYDTATDIPSLVRCIRWGDLYTILETATDRAEQAAVAVENIVVKHA
jgi:predicted phosphate transport protein (TIGR00153 family)